MLDIYSSATSPECWLSVVDRLSDLAESAGCLLFLNDYDATAPWSVSASSTLWRSLLPDIVEHYVQHYGHYERPVFAAMRDLPERTFVSTSDVEEPFHCPADRPDAIYLLEHAGVRHRAATRLNDNDAWSDSLAFQFTPDDPVVPEARLKRVMPYLPHIAKTLEFGRLYGRLQQMHSAVLAALDHVQVGMVVVAGSGEIILANRAARALMDAGDSIRLEPGDRLAARDADADRQLRSDCRTLSATAAGSLGNHCAQLLAPSSAKRLPLLLEITPLRDGLQELDRSLAAAMVMVIDPQAHDHVDSSGLARVCALSSAEADVCDHLVRGLSNKAIAERRCTSPDTVKSQIAQIYRKARVAGRTELVRLAVRMTPPVGQIPPTGGT